MADQLIDNSGLITGACVDTDCPPGFTWGCCADEPEYPETPPLISSCRSVATGITDYYNFSDMFNMNNGDNIVLMNNDFVHGLFGYRYANTELGTVYDRLAATLPGCSLDAYIHSSIKLDEEQLIFLVCTVGGSPLNSYWRIMVMNVVTNTVISNFPIPSDIESVSKPSITQYIASENTIMFSFFGRKPALDSYYYGMKINLADGQRLMECSWTSSGVAYASEVGCLQVGDFIYLGYSSFRNPDLQDNGQVTKHNKLDGSYVGIFESGEIVSGTTGRFNFGSRMQETSEHIVIWSGWYEHLSGRPAYGNAYKSYYTHLYIYDKQMNFIKRVSDTTNTGGDLSNQGFSYGFSEYGNFFLIGTPEINKVGLYDKNFNFLYVVNQSSPIMPANQSGAPLLMTSDKMYFGQANHSGLGGWDFKICDYTS